MPVTIQNIATEVPRQSYRQDFLRDQMKQYITNDERLKRIIHRIYSNSGIEKRHTVIRDFNDDEDPKFFFQDNGTFASPSTGKRNERYFRQAKKLFIKTAQKTILQNDTVEKEDITHIITVSCTGFFAPEPGFEIISQLDLPRDTERYHLGFMGCFAAFPALKMAKAFCESRPNATVLIVCLELCSLHLQPSDEIDNLISASVFADGAAGALVRSSESSNQKGLQLNNFSTAIARESKADMAWSIGDTGFDMVLSSYVPDIISTNIEEAIQPLFDDFELAKADIDHWAIHPGGRAILDKVQASLDFDEAKLSSSRKILADYGNMSSATILFVLADILDQPLEQPTENLLAMAFGPGLTIESALIEKISS